MIKAVDIKNIAECAKVIRESFSTVANEFGFTIENAPRFTAFATTEERLNWHLTEEHRPICQSQNMYPFPLSSFNMHKGQHISMESLIRICDALDCNLNDVVELVKTEE